MGTMTSKAHPSDLYIGPSQESGFLKKKKKKPFTSLGKKKKKSGQVTIILGLVRGRGW